MNVVINNYHKKKVCAMFLFICNIYKYATKLKKLKNRKCRRWSVRPINRNRDKVGNFSTTFLKIKEKDSEQFFLHTRMRRSLYDLLLNLVKESLTKKCIKKPLDPEFRLALTLSYLSQGTTHQFLAWSFKLGKTTVRNTILETCAVLWEILSPIYVNEPTEENFKQIASDFYNLWDMPNCVGAIDGKHINVTCPPNSGSQFFNYKHDYSIVLLAMCDAKYSFTAVNVGAYGSQSDGGVLRESHFGRRLLSGLLPLPGNRNLPNSEITFPHYFVGDGAFPLKNNLLRPYPGSLLDNNKKIFNYRLSRARRVIENTFGILVARWRVLRNRLECFPDNAEKIVLAAVALHNFIMLHDQSSYCPPMFADWEDKDNNLHEGEWRNLIGNGPSPMISVRSQCHNAPVSAFQFRENLATYFVNEGAIPAQNRIVRDM